MWTIWPAPRPGQHAVQVWEVTAQSAEDAAALAASQIRAVLEQLKSNGVTEGRIGMVEVDGKYYVVVDVEVTEENTFEPIRPVSDDDDSEDTPSVPAPTATVDDKTIDLSSLGNNISAKSILDLAGGNYDKDDITELDLRGCTGLTSIGTEAFQNCKKLTTVTLPKSLESIDDRAFANSGLTKINLSGCTRLERIGSGAFGVCQSLTSIDLSGCTSLDTIDSYAFMDCYSLEEINLSGCTSLDTINSTAFGVCRSLTSINLSGCKNLTSIGTSAFQYCASLKTITLPSTVTTIDELAFADSGLTSINLSGCKNLTSIDNSAFRDCASLETVLLPASLEEIGIEAFGGCTGLTRVTLPAKLTTIGGWAFYNCSGLENIYFYNVPNTIETEAFKGVKASGLTVYYNPSTCNLDDLKEALSKGGLEVDEKSPAFEPDSTLTPLTYLLGL